MLSILGIPYAMATQHPDSTRRVETSEEVLEAVQDITPVNDDGYGCDEKMVDYEGKMTPYHQPEWMVEALARAGFTPGEDYLLTPRIPAEKLENPFRQVMVMWACVAANSKAREYGGQAIKYVIHPMSETARELFIAQRRMSRIERLAAEELGAKDEEPIRIIPLVEDVVRLLHADKLISGFHNLVTKEEGLVSEGYRVLLGKSDASLGYGHLASSIALRLSLSRLSRWAAGAGARVYPILGVGKPPFRGHLAPHAADAFIRQYMGYFTVTIQSALRFNTPREDYAALLAKLAEGVGGEPEEIGEEEETLLVKAARLATLEYLKRLLKLAPRIVEVAQKVPSKRERLPPEKYGRDMSSSVGFAASRELLSYVSSRLTPLPRAIKFVAAMYTIGMPPALLGLGHGLQAIERQLGEKTLDTVLRLLPLLRLDAEFELRFYDTDLARTYVGDELARDYEDDIRLVKDYLGVDGPGAHGEYVKTLWEIRRRMPSGNVEALVDQSAEMRGFLG